MIGDGATRIGSQTEEDERRRQLTGWLIEAGFAQRDRAASSIEPGGYKACKNYTRRKAPSSTVGALRSGRDR
jgi:hypothetical protein